MSLWRNRDFLRLWSGQTVSELGTAVTTLALPSLAVLDLHAGPAAVGLLLAAQRLPFAVLSLPAGAVVDRHARRTIMILTDLGRLLLLGVVPVLAALGVLRFWHLVVLAAATGSLTVFFDVAFLSYVPALVERHQVLEGSARLQVSYSVGAVGGPGLGGLLVQAVGAARAVAVDALSYGVSAVLLLLIRRQEAHVDAEPGSRSLRTEIGEGVRSVFGHPVLRSLVLCVGLAGIPGHSMEGVLIVFAYHDLGLSPGVFGATLATAGLGAIVGSLLVRRAIGWLGAGPAIAWGFAAYGLALGATPLAARGAPVLVLVVLFVLSGACDGVSNLAQQSLRQLLTPDRLRGRMNAVFRMVYWTGWPIGNLLGGAAAAALGPAPTLAAAGILTAAGSLAMLPTPAGRVGRLPEAEPG